MTARPSRESRPVYPFPIILSAPSGGGKTTIRQELLKLRPDVGYSVSATTRLPRSAEADGRDYHFLSHGEFESKRERGEFAEWAEVHGRLYGTLRREVQSVIESGKHVIMDIGVQGARQFVEAFPSTVLIFLLPPSAAVLLTRLKTRRTEDPADLVLRLETARRELMSLDLYEYVVVNQDLREAVQVVSSIIDAETVRRVRVSGLKTEVAALIAGLDREIAALTSSATAPARPY
jgi:guanylate kinase